jgi:hypothetical protein
MLCRRDCSLVRTRSRYQETEKRKTKPTIPNHDLALHSLVGVNPKTSILVGSNPPIEPKPPPVRAALELMQSRRKQPKQAGWHSRKVMARAPQAVRVAVAPTPLSSLRKRRTRTRATDVAVPGISSLSALRSFVFIVNKLVTSQMTVDKGIDNRAR